MMLPQRVGIHQRQVIVERKERCLVFQAWCHKAELFTTCYLEIQGKRQTRQALERPTLAVRQPVGTYVCCVVLRQSAKLVPTPW